MSWLKFDIEFRYDGIGQRQGQKIGSVRKTSVASSITYMYCMLIMLFRSFSSRSENTYTVLREIQIGANGNNR